jgi:hypothetical protein
LSERDDLPPHARDLLDAARDADDPTAADRERIDKALAAELIAAGIVPAVLAPAPLAAAPAAAAATAGAAGLGTAAKLAIVLVSVGVAAGGMVAVREHSRPRAAPREHAAVAVRAPHALPARAPIAAVPQPAVEAPETPVPQAAVVAPAPAPAPTQFPPVSPALRSPTARREPAPLVVAAQVTDSVPDPPTQMLDPSLREEVAVLDRASEALRSNRPAEAILLLDEHSTRFANSPLGEEWRGLRVIALCKAGPFGDALEARAAFLRDAPSSLLAPKVRAACAVDPAAGVPRNDD